MESSSVGRESNLEKVFLVGKGRRVKLKDSCDCGSGKRWDRCCGRMEGGQ